MLFAFQRFQKTIDRIILNHQLPNTRKAQTF
jgi:hypothetical protein